MRWSALLHSLALATQSNGLQQEEILHGSFKGSRLLLIQAVDDVIAILGPEVKPEFRCFTCFEIFEYRNAPANSKNFNALAETSVFPTLLELADPACREARQW